MAQLESFQSEKALSGQKTVAVQVNSRLELKARISPSRFKYYIHDGVDACRMQLVGDLAEPEIQELNGCWTTAKTTLGNRKMLLDLRGVFKIDESARQWIISMVNSGAILLPEKFLANGLAGQPVLAGRARKPGFFARLLAGLRGSRTLPAQSPTQAQ